MSSRLASANLVCSLTFALVFLTYTQMDTELNRANDKRIWVAMHLANLQPVLLPVKEL